MAWKLSNFAQSTLRQSCTIGATTLYIDADEVDLLPTLGASDKAKAVLLNGTNREIINITAWTTDGTLTVERAQETTAARAWDAGTILIHTPTAEVLQNVINATTNTKYIGTATNIGNAYTLNVGVGNPLPTFTTGEEASFILPASCSGAATLAVTDGTTTVAAKTIVHQDDQTLEDRDLLSGWLAVLRYNSSLDSWVLLSDSSYNQHSQLLNDGPIPAISRHPNGRLESWKNGTSFSSPVTGTETADGWLVQHDGTIGTFTVNRQSFTLGQTVVPANPKYSIRWDHSSAGSGSTFRRFAVRIPGVEWRNGEQGTRRIYAKADSARNVTARTVQHFGTGGSPSADVTVSSTVLAVTTSWQAFDITATFPSITGKTLGSGGDDAIFLYLDLPVNVTMTIDFANDVLVQGHLGMSAPWTFPVPTWLGGTGAVYNSFSLLAAALATSGSYLTSSAIGVTVQAYDADLAALAVNASNGLWARTGAGTGSVRSVAVGTGLSVANGDGVAGNPTVSLGTALTNYNTDPLSVAELASITAVFGTAAFVNTGTSGATVALCNGANTWAAAQTYAAANLFTPDNTVDIGASGATRPRTIHVGTSIELGAASDTTITRVSAGVIAVEGVNVLTTATGAQLAATNTHTAGVQLGTDGSVTAPSWSFTSDTNTGLYRIGADNLGVALNGVNYLDMSTSRSQFVNDVTFSANVNPTSTLSLGYRGTPTDTQNVAYGFVLGDAGKTIYHDEVTARTYTIPANASVAFPVGTVIIIDNTGNSGAAGAITLAITTDTLRRGDGTAGTGSRTIAASQVAAIRKVAATVWVITGSFT